INDKATTAIWEDRDNLEAWAKTIPALPAEEQLKQVVAKLRERNIGFDGKVIPTFDKGKQALTGLDFVVDAVLDVSPIRALPGLQRLGCRGSAVGKGALADLWPLQGLQLTFLACSNTQVLDLTPLQNMPLTNFGCDNTRIVDLSPLKTTPLQTL